MSVAPVLDLRPTGLPPVPPPELDRYLDAAARCFSRYGVARTTVGDIARELRVSRATVYRQVGNFDVLGRQLFAREIHRLLLTIPDHLDGLNTADAVVHMTAAVITAARQHPVLAKVLADEPQLAWSLLMQRVDELVDRAAPVVEAVLAGALAGTRIDTRLAAEWLIRLAASLVLAPTNGDLRSFLGAVVRPVLAGAGPQ